MVDFDRFILNCCLLEFTIRKLRSFELKLNDTFGTYQHFKIVFTVLIKSSERRKASVENRNCFQPQFAWRLGMKYCQLQLLFETSIITHILSSLCVPKELSQSG